MVSDINLHPIPGLRPVLLEQIRAVGLALRREAALLAATGLLLSAALAIDVLEDGGSVDLTPDIGILFTALGAMLPWVVWRGERLFGDAALWTFPVERRWHAATKAAAGWVWLMILTALGMAWAVSLALLTGGAVGLDETRLLLAGAGPAAPVTEVRWVTPFWQWLMPFTAATISYLLITAFVLAVQHPLRWAGGALLAVALLAGAGPVVVLEGAVEFLVTSRYGLDYVITGGVEALDTLVRLPDGRTFVAWRTPPSLGGWAAATTLWMAFGVLAVWTATFRHREG